eukprot:TRINITY_DN3864_c0_g2_i1.p1 TRINITY_DN3864_c0_g2~~TRINITY_DN3864_c0_g2_i1.p1  ORF type:complete len:135 (-),score=5.89 TRINITY_DN3864_c0_g2_i1:604-1008(-)
MEVSSDYLGAQIFCRVSHKILSNHVKKCNKQQNNKSIMKRFECNYSYDVIYTIGDKIFATYIFVILLFFSGSPKQDLHNGLFSRNFQVENDQSPKFNLKIKYLEKIAKTQTCQNFLSCGITISVRLWNLKPAED